MSEDGRERKNAFRVFTQSEYEEVMEKGYFVMYEPDADLLLGWYWFVEEELEGILELR